MIVGGYSLDLYCDAEGHAPDPAGGSGVHQFFGHVKADAFNDARKAGWKLFEVRNKAICPACVKAGRYLTKP